MKKIIMMRHAEKEGDFLSPKGIQDAHNLILLADFLPLELVCSSKRVRALLTAMLICNGNQQKNTRIDVPEEIWGPSQMLRNFGWDFSNFNHLLEKFGTHRAVFEKLGKPDDLKLLKEQLLAKICRLFNKIRDGENCLLLSHSPIIELTVEALEEFLAKEKNQQATNRFTQDIPCLGYVVFGREGESGEVQLLGIKK